MDGLSDLATDRQLNQEQAWARPTSPRFLLFSLLICLQWGFCKPFIVKGSVSQSVIGVPQILPPSLCRKICPAREAQGWQEWGVGRGEAGLLGVCRRRCYPDSQPVEPTSTGMGGSHTWPGALGPQGTPDTKWLPLQSQE